MLGTSYLYALQILQAIANAIDYLATLDGIILLLKAPHTWVVENIKLLVIWMLHLYWLAYIVLDSSMNAVSKDKS